jgi:transposase
MARSSRHPREVRERAVALVLESQSDYGSQWEEIVSIVAKVVVPQGVLRLRFGVGAAASVRDR